MRRIATATILSLVLAACSADSLGPDPVVLVGSFGSVLDPAELLATRVGVQLNLACGGYFITREPLRVDAAGDFRVHGKSYPGSRGRGLRPRCTMCCRKGPTLTAT